MNAPPSAHTYDNTNYLPAIDRMLVLGGAAFQSGGAYTVQVNATTSRVTGPYLFDPAKADATKVGGTNGSGADVTQPLEFDTYDTQVLDSYRTNIKIADYK